jgi:hypothetical protein
VAPTAPLRKAAPRPAQAKPAPSPGDGDNIAREIAMTGEMKRLARTDPVRCLALASRARNEFGDGMMGVERTAYEVVAMFGAGRLQQARKRAGTYLEEHPAGPQADRIRSLLGQ